ncbi:MAG: hypothetical protein AVDCRST_MAG89-4418, partial [uncultured Gemmatimonadetes bacterium]
TWGSRPPRRPGWTPDREPPARVGRLRGPGRHRALSRRGVGLGARHARVPGKRAARLASPGAAGRAGAGGGVPVRLPVRLAGRRHLPRQEVRPRGAPLPPLAHRRRDPGQRAHGPAEGHGAGLPGAPGRRHHRPQLLRPPPAAADLLHQGAGARLLGGADGHAPAGALPHPGAARGDGARPQRGRRPLRPGAERHALLVPHQPPAVPRDDPLSGQRPLADGVRDDGGPLAVGPDGRGGARLPGALVRLRGRLPFAPGRGPVRGAGPHRRAQPGHEQAGAADGHARRGVGEPFAAARDGRQLLSASRGAVRAPAHPARRLSPSTAAPRASGSL